MAVQGFFVSRSGLLLTALAIVVIIPLLLVKAGIENAYTDFFANPFTAFACVFILGVVSLHRYIRANIIASFILLAGIACVAYLYVWALLL